MMSYKLVLDEPWTFLNVRKNPVEGRRLTFELRDGTILTIDVSKAEWGDIAKIKEKVLRGIEFHEAIAALTE